MKRLLALAILVAPFAAQAQTVDFYLNLDGGIFAGTLSPVVDVNDRFGGGTFTEGGAGATGGQLIAFYDVPPPGVPVWESAEYTNELTFTLSGTTITSALWENDVGYTNSTGFASCGTIPGYTPPPGSPQGPCEGSVTTVATASAPEINPSVAVGALTLLVGGIVVFRGRRPSALAA